MKILYVIMCDEPSGGNKIIFEHSNALTDKGHDVSIWFCNEFKQYAWMPIKSKILLNSYNVRDDYDLVVLTYFETCFRKLGVMQLDNIPMVYLVQGREPYFRKEADWKERVEKTFDLGHSKFITISKQLQTWLKDDYGIDSDYIPNGIDLQLFKPGGKKKCEEPVILIEGNFDFWLKGVADALHACKLLRKEGRKFRLWHLSSRGMQLDGVDTHFHNPPVHLIPEVYSAADIVIKPSYMEGSPLPHMETMACGTLLVTSDCPGADEYCDDGLNCYTYTTGNVEGLKRALSKALDNPEESAKIVKSAQVFAQKNFGWKDKIDLLERTLQKVIEDGRKQTKSNKRK